MGAHVDRRCRSIRAKREQLLAITRLVQLVGIERHAGGLVRERHVGVDRVGVRLDDVDRLAATRRVATQDVDHERGRVVGHALHRSGHDHRRFQRGDARGVGVLRQLHDRHRRAVCNVQPRCVEAARQREPGCSSRQRNRGRGVVHTRDHEAETGGVGDCDPRRGRERHPLQLPAVDCGLDGGSGLGIEADGEWNDLGAGVQARGVLLGRSPDQLRQLRPCGCPIDDLLGPGEERLGIASRGHLRGAFDRELSELRPRPGIE